MGIVDVVGLVSKDLTFAVDEQRDYKSPIQRRNGNELGQRAKRRELISLVFFVSGDESGGVRFAFRMVATFYVPACKIRVWRDTYMRFSCEDARGVIRKHA